MKYATIKIGSYQRVKRVRVTRKSDLFWNVTLCRLEESYSFHLQAMTMEVRILANIGTLKMETSTVL